MFWEDDNSKIPEEKVYIPPAEDLLYLSLEDVQKIPKQELYRFIVDGQLHQDENGWYEYAKREPNSLPACLNAFQGALSHNTHDISIDFIKKIHKTVTDQVEKINPHNNPGEFRNNQGGYFLIQGAHPFISKEGFFQLFKKVNVEYCHYGACIASLTRLEAINLSSPKYYELVAAMKNTELSADVLWEENLDFFQNNILFYRAPDAAYLQILLQKICDEYNYFIKHASSAEEKLKVIANTIQVIEQLHAFPDANGRTSLILLQLLLIQNGFYPAMLYNPNYIDGYSLNELIDEIKKGIYNTKKIIENPNEPVHHYQTKIFSLASLKENDPLLHKIISDYYAAENELYKYLHSLKSSSLDRYNIK